MLLTIIIFSCVLIWYATALPSRQPVAAKPADSRVNVLVCFIDFDAVYALNITDGSCTAVKKLYCDCSAYSSGGLSGMKSAAESFCSEKFDQALCVTETQLAAIIDYAGGVLVKADSALSEICGIKIGTQTLAGITAVQIFEYEPSYRTLCLDIVTQTAENWCRLLWNKRSFFKLLDLSESTLSYAKYLPYSEKFKKYADNG